MSIEFAESDDSIRVRVEDDEIGIYYEDEWIRFVYFDQQSKGVFEFPFEMAADLGRALIALEKDPGAPTTKLLRISVEEVE